MRKEPVEFATLQVLGNLSKVSFSGGVEAEADDSGAMSGR